MSLDTKPLSSLAMAVASAIGAVLIVYATPAPAAPVSLSNASSYLTVLNADHATSPGFSGSLSATLSDSGSTTTLTFTPSNYVVSGSQKAIFSSGTTVSPGTSASATTYTKFDVFGKETAYDPNSGIHTGYALRDLSINFNGKVSWLRTGTIALGNSPSATLYNNSFAGTASITYGVSLDVIGVNFDTFGSLVSQPFGPILFQRTYSRTSVSGDEVLNDQFVLAAEDMQVIRDSVRSSLGWASNKPLEITGVRVNSLDLTLSTFARGGQAKAEITSLTASADTALVAVPEPPTVILAGLGVAAVVANGYRRRRLRRQDVGVESDLEASECEVALSA